MLRCEDCVRFVRIVFVLSGLRLYCWIYRFVGLFGLDTLRKEIRVLVPWDNNVPYIPRHNTQCLHRHHSLAHNTPMELSPHSGPVHGHPK